MKKIKIIGLKTFKKMPGFSFFYVEPKEWGADTTEKINKNEFIILNPNWPTNKINEIDPQIRITKEKNLGLNYLKGKRIDYSNIINGKAPSEKAKKNSKGILYDSYIYASKYAAGYELSSEQLKFDYIEFFGSDFGVKIEFINHPYKEVFANEVVESFKFQ